MVQDGCGQRAFLICGRELIGPSPGLLFELIVIMEMKNIRKER